MERDTQKLIALVTQMREMAPDLASSGIGRRVDLQLSVCNNYTVGSVCRHDQARKAVLTTAKALAEYFSKIADDKDRAVEWAEALLLVGPTILEGGRVRARVIKLVPTP